MQKKVNYMRTVLRYQRVIRSLKSKMDRQYNGQPKTAKRTNNNQRWTDNTMVNRKQPKGQTIIKENTTQKQRSSNMNPTKNWGLTQVFRRMSSSYSRCGTCHVSLVAIPEMHESGMREGPDCDDNRKTSVVIFDANIILLLTRTCMVATVKLSM